MACLYQVYGRDSSDDPVTLHGMFVHSKQVVSSSIVCFLSQLGGGGGDLMHLYLLQWLSGHHRLLLAENPPGHRLLYVSLCLLVVHLATRSEASRILVHDQVRANREATVSSCSGDVLRERNRTACTHCFLKSF